MPIDHEVLQVVRRHGTQHVWHYTRCSSLAGIIEHGAILSRAELLRRGITFESGHYYGTEKHERVLGEYVSGAPLPPWGMMQFETEQIALLRLHPAVLAIAETCFCPGWSPRGGFDPDEIVTWTGPQHLEALYTGTGPLMVNPSEFFVPERIPLRAVEAIVFFDDASRDRALPLLREGVARREKKLNHTVQILIAPVRFPRDWRESGPPWEGDDDGATA